MIHITQAPYVAERPHQTTLGIRIRTPMRGMHPMADHLRKELDRWFVEHRLTPSGHGFLRLYVIDMAGWMDIEVGLPVEQAHPGDDRVRCSQLPAGRYACIAFVGHGLVGNKTLLEAMRLNHWQADRWDDPSGDAFACRCETVLTDRKVFALKKSWEIEVSIRLVENANLYAPRVLA